MEVHIPIPAPSFTYLHSGGAKRRQNKIFSWWILFLVTSFLYISFPVFAYQSPKHTCSIQRNKYRQLSSVKKYQIVTENKSSEIRLSLSTSSIANLALLRGGVTAPLQNFSGAASGFFGGVRIPASLIAGAALGQMFSLASVSKSIEHQNGMNRVLIITHNICMFFAFMLSIAAVVIATAATVTILHGGFDPTAQSAYSLLKREFEFEFVSTRLGFLVSLVSFLSGVTCRILYEFDLLRVGNGRREGALSIIFGMIALVSLLLNYINTTLYCWSNLGGMVIYFFKVSAMTHFASF